MNGRACASSVPDYPLKRGGFKPEIILDEGSTLSDDMPRITEQGVYIGVQSGMGA